MTSVPEIFVVLVLAAIPLVALAKRVDISYPIVLVIGGLVLGFVPHLPAVQLDPDLVLLIFLPPLLYWESITAPTDVMLENAGQIGVLAIGLVVATTVAVAVTAHALVPGMSWAVAFVLGAIVSPTDELAAVPVLEHFRLPRHLIAIIDGESLLNDATALVLYATAIAAATTGVFLLGHTLLQMLVTVIGSLAIGYLVGLIAVALWRRITDVQLQGVISVIVPFLAYLPAEKLGMSGVLAVVVAGVSINRQTARVLTAASRTQIVGFWNTLVFLANAILFLLVGLQLHRVADTAFSHHPWGAVVGYAIAVNVVIVVVRISLALLAEYAPTLAPPDHAAPNWKNALIAAWSGLCGAVSLAAALAIPIALPDGSPFPYRDLIVFVTFSVILVTLVGGGLTLPALVRSLHVVGGTEEQDEVRLARVRSAQAAIDRIDELAAEGRVDDEHAARLRELYAHKIELASGTADADGAEHAARHVDVEREIIAAQRRAIIGLREDGAIDNVAFRVVQAELDAASQRGELKD